MLDSAAPQPSTIVQIIDRTFRIYRDNFITFIGLVAIINIPLLVVTIPVNIAYQNDLMRMMSSGGFITTLPASYWAVIGIGLLAALLQGVFVAGTITYITSESYLAGTKITIQEAIQNTSPRFTALFTGLFLFSFMVGGLTFGVTFVGILCFPVLIFFGFIAYLGLAVYYFIVPVLTLENVGGQAGISRAWTLGRARFWQMFGLVLLVSVITFVISLAFETLVGLFTSPMLTPATLNIYMAITMIMSTALSLFIAPILPIALTLAYYDVRVRVEGLDIAMQTSDQPNPRPFDLPSPVTKGLSMNNQDFVNIGLLIGGAVLLLGGLTLLSVSLVDVLGSGFPF